MYNYLITFSLLLVGGYAYEIRSPRECVCSCPPPDSCTIGNLTIVNARGNLIMDDIFNCNHVINEYDLTDAPYVNLSRIPDKIYKNATYTLIVMDKTAKQLIWLLSNIRAQNKEIISDPSGNLNPTNIRTIRYWSYPRLNASSEIHEIEFLLVVENFTKPLDYYESDPIYVLQEPFNLNLWLELHSIFNNHFCGPVAAGRVKMTHAGTRPATTAGSAPEKGVTNRFYSNLFLNFALYTTFRIIFHSS